MVEFRNKSNTQGRPLSFHGPEGINNVRFRACSVKDSVYDDKFRNVRYHTVAVAPSDGKPPTVGAAIGGGAAAAATAAPGATASEAGSRRGEAIRGDVEGPSRKPTSNPASTAGPSRERFGVFSGGSGVGGGNVGAHNNFSCPREDAPRREWSPPIDAAAIERIRSTSDLYEILGVLSGADEACLKRAYRKLALSLHPDKNDGEGAAEAFKSVSNAFAILSDADKRRKYDNWSKANKWRKRNDDGDGGATTAAASRRDAWVKRGTGSAKSATTAKDDSSDDGDDAAKFHSDISAEELFNMFFGTGNKSRNDENVHVHRAQHRPQEGDSWSSGGSLFLHLLPILLLFVLSTTSNIFMGESPYSLKPSQKYPEARATKKLEIPYFLKADFVKSYKKSRIPEIEEEIEDDYVNTLKGKCEKEKKKRDLEESSNRKSSDRKHRQNSHAHTTTHDDQRTPSCQLLRRVNLAGYYINS